MSNSLESNKNFAKIESSIIVRNTLSTIQAHLSELQILRNENMKIKQDFLSAVNEKCKLKHEKNVQADTIQDLNNQLQSFKSLLLLSERDKNTKKSFNQIKLELALKETENTKLTERLLAAQVQINAMQVTNEKLTQNARQLELAAANFDKKYDQIFSVMKTLNVNLKTLEKDHQNVEKIVTIAEGQILRAKDGIEFYEKELERQKGDNKIVRKELADLMMSRNSPPNVQKGNSDNGGEKNNFDEDCVKGLLKLYQDRNVDLMNKLANCSDIKNIMAGVSNGIETTDIAVQTELNDYLDQI